MRVRVGVGSDAEKALKRVGQSARPPVDTWGLIDTGAARSVLQRGLATELGLTPVGAVEIDTPSSTNLEALEYLVRIWFNDRLGLDAKAMEAPLPVETIRLLIGRDILARGEFDYRGRKNEFRLSF